MAVTASAPAVDPLACIALRHRRRDDGFSDLELRGVPFAELWSSQPQVFDGAYLLVTRFESEMAVDGGEASRELQAEGYFVERLGSGAFICRGDGVAVLHDLGPQAVEIFRLPGPMTREDFRRIRVAHGSPRAEEAFLRGVGASLHLLWQDGDRGTVTLADDALVDELLLFTVQLGLFGRERLLSTAERQGLLEALRPLLDDQGLLVERTVVHAGGDVEAAVLGWYPDEGLFDRWEVEGLSLKATETGDFLLGPRRKVHLLVQLGWLRYGSLRFGLLFTALASTVFLVAVMILSARLWSLGWTAWPILVLVVFVGALEAGLWTRIAHLRLE